MSALLPVVAHLQPAFWIDQDVGNVLDIADLAVTAPHFKQWIERRARPVGRIKAQDAAEPCAPACGELPVLALDVMHDS